MTNNFKPSSSDGPRPTTDEQPTKLRDLMRTCEPDFQHLKPEEITAQVTDQRLSIEKMVPAQGVTQRDAKKS